MHAQGVTVHLIRSRTPFNSRFDPQNGQAVAVKMPRNLETASRLHTTLFRTNLISYPNPEILSTRHWRIPLELLLRTFKFVNDHIAKTHKISQALLQDILDIDVIYMPRQLGHGFWMEQSY